jgi:hypothetical protein
MKPQPTNLARLVLGAACLIGALAPTAAHADGSIEFNGGTSVTSKLENATADVLANSNDMTICVWVYHAGLGLQSAGKVLTLDETGQSGVQLHHNNSTTSLTFAALSPTTNLLPQMNRSSG